jgi:MoxR-like ATPase
VPARARGGGGVTDGLGTPADVTRTLAGEGYLADRGLSTAVYLAATLEQPLLLEGEAAWARPRSRGRWPAATGSRLIRLQCHEGIDLHHAVYDWDYGRQLLAIRAAEAGGRGARAVRARVPAAAAAAGGARGGRALRSC